MRKALKSKTVLAAAALAALSVFQGFIAQLPLTPVEQGAIGMGVAALMVVLRSVTTVPLSEK